MNGILLNAGDDLDIQVRRDGQEKITGGLVVGERKMQDAYLVLKANMGDFKEDPVLGANLLLNIRDRQDRQAVKKAITVSLMRVGITLDDIKDDLQVIINRDKINI